MVVRSKWSSPHLIIIMCYEHCTNISILMVFTCIVVSVNNNFVVKIYYVSAARITGIFDTFCLFLLTEQQSYLLIQVGILIES